jgi:hypothetical protein
MGDAEVVTVGPATLHADGSVDATVAVGTALGRLPPGPVLWVAPPWDAEATPAAVELEAVGAHPLAAGLDLAGTRLVARSDAAVPAWAEPVLAAGGRVLLHAGVHAGRREAVLAVDPSEGDLAARVGFPLLVRRLVRWLAEPAHAPTVLGGRLTLAAPADVRRPNGARLRRADAVTLDEPGLYRLEQGGRQVVASVLAGDPLESDLGRRLVAARDAASGDAPIGAPRPFWQAFAAAGLLLAAIEAAWRRAPSPAARSWTVEDDRRPAERVR